MQAFPQTVKVVASGSTAFPVTGKAPHKHRMVNNQRKELILALLMFVEYCEPNFLFFFGGGV